MSRDSLTREVIVDAAIASMDEDGIEGLSMRSLGVRLDCAATAVYWHVGSKENLMALAADRAWSQIELPDVGATSWRVAATQLAVRLRDMLTRHGWMLEAFGSFSTFGEGKARYDDRCLAVYEAAGFRGAAIDRAAATIFTFVLGNALGPTAAAAMVRKIQRGGRAAKKVMRERAAAARTIAMEFPRLRARLDTPFAADGAVADETFELGLGALLDAFAAQLAREGDGARTRTRSARKPSR